MRAVGDVVRWEGCLLRRVVCICAAIALALGYSSEPALATAPGANGPIVFSSYGKIYTVQPDGSELRQVVRAEEDHKYDFSPSWSPNGLRIVTSGQLLGPDLFWTSMNLQLFAPDGTGFQQLSMPHEYVEEPAWSPDGTRILFARSSGLFSTTPDGKSVSLVKDGAGGPAWSPDGSRIAFVRSVDPEIDTDLYTMSSDGSDVRKLLTFPGRETSPSWSPDGSTIVFTHSPREGDSHPYSYPDDYVYTVPATGGQPVRLTESGSDSAPTWSPDGSLIVFQSDRPPVHPATATGLYLMSADGGGERQLNTAIDCFQCDPDWASIPLDPQPPGPPAAQERRRQRFAGLSITRRHFAKPSRVRVYFWAAVAEKVRFTIRRADPLAPAIRCGRQPRDCRLARRAVRRVREGLNRVPLRSLFARALTPGRYWLQIDSRSGPARVGLSFRVIPHRSGQRHRHN